MTLKECFATLGLKEGASLSDIKKAYRTLAFSLHPDLNPDIPNASRRFQKLNEAYVALTQDPSVANDAAGQQDQPGTSKTREEAKKAYEKAQKTQEKRQKTEADPDGSRRRKEDVLQDILNDPFARRVFEDIYSHISQEQGKSGKRTQQPGKQKPFTAEKGKPTSPTPGKNTGAVRRTPTQPKQGLFLTKISGWLKKQIDEEQTLYLPGNSLLPGARVRLQIQHGFNAEPQTIEVTLPEDFTPGTTIRLKGMGKHVGSWKGDLYIRLEPA